MLLKTYLVTIGIFWIALLIINKIIKIQLKRDGLYERMKELNKAESLIDHVKNVSGCVILSIVPVINIIMAGYMFIGIDAIYIKVKEKCLPEDAATRLARKLSEAFEKNMKAAEDSLKEKSV